MPKTESERGMHSDMFTAHRKCRRKLPNCTLTRQTNSLRIAACSCRSPFRTRRDRTAEIIRLVPPITLQSPLISFPSIKRAPANPETLTRSSMPRPGPRLICDKNLRRVLCDPICATGRRPVSRPNGAAGVRLRSRSLKNIAGVHAQ